MITGFEEQDAAAGDPLRARQESEIALGHSLTRAEFDVLEDAA